MRRLLALEWDAQEARIAVARSGLKDIVVEQAFAVALTPRDAGSANTPEDLGAQIAKALAARSIRRCETLVAVGRANIELRRLTLPPSPEAELPEIVRFQALRQFTGIGEDWPLDFVSLETGDAESMSVLAAAISPELVADIKTTCQAGELTPRRLILRPFAAASLLRRRDGGRPQPCRMMVDMLAEEADLTVLVDQQVVLVRTVRLPAADEPGGQVRALLGEIRRTLAAAHNQIRDRRIEQVIVCGDGEEQSSLRGMIEQELSLSAELFDPFADVALAGQLRTEKPELPGRFAPLLGMLRDEAAGTGHAMDFLHPRKKAKPPSYTARYLAISGVAAAILIAAVAAVWAGLSSLDGQIGELAARKKELQKSQEAAELRRKDAAAIDDFLANDFHWLDEMYEISGKLPKSEDVVITQVTLGNRTPRGGQIILDGYANEPDHINAVGDALRSKDRQVISNGGQFDERQKKYRWKFKETALIEPKGGAPSPDSTGTAKSKKSPARKTKDILP